MSSICSITTTRHTTIRAAMQALDQAASGILLLLSADDRFSRTVTDGDLRRLLLDGASLDDTLATLPALESVVLHEGYTVQAALALMNKYVINHLPILDHNGMAVHLVSRLDLDEQILLSTPHMGDFEKEYVEEAFRSNWIAPLGPNVTAFEQELASHIGVAHAAALSSGTAAIHLALRLLDVIQGDIVFCSALTFVASANPIIYLGAKPVFIDSEPESWNMSPVALERALVDAHRKGQLPKAVIVVNLYGQSADYDPIIALCNNYNVPIIEDAAESLGAFYKDKPSGTFGKLGIFSFNGNKIITTSGGGMLVSQDGGLIEKARFLSTQARDPAPYYQHTEIGYNYRMSNILAGVGRGQLKVLDQRVRSRQAIFNRYQQELVDLEEMIQWMPEPDWSQSTRWLSTFTLVDKTRPADPLGLIARLAAIKIEARPIWKPMHLQPVFTNCSYYPHHADQSVSEYLFNRGICLPSGSNMTEMQQARVITALRELLREI